MTTIKSSTTATTAYQVVADTTGALVIQTGVTPTTAVTISAAQVVTFANPPVGVFPSGTKMMFVQTAAPTGWTKDTTHNDKALRVVSGSASSGGSVAFTTAFASQAVAGTVGTSGATTLSTAQIPSHTHTQNAHNHNYYGGNTGGGSFNISPYAGGISQRQDLGAGTSLDPQTATNQNTGGGGSHDHSGGTFTGTAINLAVQYVDVIIATKD